MVRGAGLGNPQPAWLCEVSEEYDFRQADISSGSVPKYRGRVLSYYALNTCHTSTFGSYDRPMIFVALFLAAVCVAVWLLPGAVTQALIAVVWVLMVGGSVVLTLLALFGVT